MMTQVPFWKRIIGGGPLRKGSIGRWALEYVAALDQWATDNGTTKEDLYYQEFVEHPELLFYLLSRIVYFGDNTKDPTTSASNLATVAFMAGFIAGVRRARIGVGRAPSDINQKYVDASTWVASEQEEQRGDHHADRYLQGMIEEEDLAGKPRGVLAEEEQERNTELAALFEYVAASGESLYPEVSRDDGLHLLALDIFKVGLVAGARACMQGHVKGAKK